MIESSTWEEDEMQYHIDGWGKKKKKKKKKKILLPTICKVLFLPTIDWAMHFMQ